MIWDPKSGHESVHFFCFNKKMDIIYKIISKKYVLKRTNKGDR